MRFSSGPFLLPVNAVSVDWAVINTSNKKCKYTVVVYQHSLSAPRTIVPPGPVTDILPAHGVSHNANSVSLTGPFMQGFYYEVVLQTASAAVLPNVSVWQDMGAGVIPGTTIPSGSFVKFQ